MENVFRAVRRLVDDFADLNVIFPMHLNSHVREIAQVYLAGSDHIQLVEPFDVYDLHNILARCSFVLTDSGGIQEEATSLEVPTLVLRDSTERTEGVESHVLRLIGTDENLVYTAVRELLLNRPSGESIRKEAGLYGDGEASQKILGYLYDFLATRRAGVC